jgi:O-antigen ligase
MNNRLRSMFPAISVAFVLLLTAFLIFFRPGYLLSVEYLGVLVFVEILAAVIWKFPQRFFPFLIVIFIAASTTLPFQSARWFLLGAGAIVGCVLCLKTRLQPVGLFHWLALFCILAALLSATAPDYPKQALLKSLSLLLLFLYGAFGARLAVAGRAENFARGLLLGCEALVYLLAVCYFVLDLQFLGNPNSLGLVTGVVALPILLWGILVSDKVLVRRRRVFAFLLTLVLLLSSYSRASIAAGAISCALLCMILRRYKLLTKGCIVAALAAVAVVAIAPPLSETPNSVSSAFLYKGHTDGGLLGSRKSVWEKTISTIREHPLLGTGFGTIGSNFETGEISGRYSSSSAITREHGNSYLAIIEGVGLLGVLPFFTLVILVGVNATRVLMWTRTNGEARSLALPIAIVIVAALFHASFEDWLFAVGNYLCVFFWSLAFILVDLVPARESQSSSNALPASFSRMDRLDALPSAQ